MDGLALLCNLHADGPLSLRRLRDVGVETLEDIQLQTEGSLGEILKASPSQVRRFLHEGRLLRARLREMPLESEFAAGEAVPGETRPLSIARKVRPPIAYDLDPPDVAPSVVVPVSPAVQAREDAEPIESLEPEPEPEVRPAPPAPLVDPQGTPLKIGEIEGLDAKTCERLVAEGVRTYKALVDLASLNLARRTSISLTRLMDLRHHARAHLLQRLQPADAAQEHGAEDLPGERLVEIVPRPREVQTPSAKPVAKRPAPPARAPSVSRSGTLHEEPGVAGPFV